VPLPWLVLPIALGAEVAVELPPMAGADAWERVLHSCDSVLGDNVCVRRAHPPDTELPVTDSSARPTSSPAPSKLAELWWEADILHLRFSVTRGGSTETLERSLSFAPTDPAPERWVAAGLMVAALAAGVRDVAATPDPEADGRTAEPKASDAQGTRPLTPPIPVRLAQSVPPRDEPSAKQKARPPLNFDLGAVLGPGMTTGHWRLGPVLRATWLPFGDFGLTVDARTAYSEDVVQLQWSSLALGPTWRLGSSARLGLDAHAGAVIEWTQASATRTGEVDTARATRWGGRACLSAWLGLSEHLSLWVGVDASQLSPDLEIHLQGVAVAKQQGPSWSGSGGLRLQLDP
jgi:hypothetical protein